MIGLGTSIESVTEFNRRAAIAFKGVRFGYGRGAEIVASCEPNMERGLPLTPKQQQAIFNIAHRYRGQITDRMVIEYAAAKTKGAD